jgi:hypothetical protein
VKDRFSPGRLGDWIVFCDICGQKHYASETTKLSTYTGKGGLVVCKHDVDKIDAGLVPYSIKREKNVPFIRINHTNTSNAAPLVDLEEMAYQWYLASSQDNVIIMSSQDDAWIISTEPF